MVKVRIYKPHTHAGVSYNPGPEGLDIEVSVPDAEFLRNVGALEAPQPNPAVAADPTPVASESRGARRKS